jgi:hypothetical protein
MSRQQVAGITDAGYSQISQTSPTILTIHQRLLRLRLIGRWSYCTLA